MDTKQFLPALIAATLLSSCHEPAVPLPASGSENEVPSKLLPVLGSQLSAALLPANERCNLEGILDGVHYLPLDAGQTPLKRKPAVVYGWLSPQSVAKSQARIRLRFSNDGGTQAWETDITRWVERDDVVATLDGDVWEKPGFAQPVDFDLLPPANYKMTIIFEDSTKSYVCDKGRGLILK